MAKFDVRNITGALLDYALYKAEGGAPRATTVLPAGMKKTDANLWDIVTREGICIVAMEDGTWSAAAKATFDPSETTLILGNPDMAVGTTPRVAAARARIAQVFGSFGIDLP